jgi:hypothetical protein
MHYSTVKNVKWLLYASEVCWQNVCSSWYSHSESRTFSLITMLHDELVSNSEDIQHVKRISVGRNKNVIQYFLRKNWRAEASWKFNFRWADNIKVKRKKVECGSLQWIRKRWGSNQCRFSRTPLCPCACNSGAGGIYRLADGTSSSQKASTMHMEFL